MTVCRVKEWHEVRLPGKFVRIFDIEDDTYEAVLSKWFYHLEVNDRPQRVFITVHQEDERIKGVMLRRPYCDVGITILRLVDQGGVELYDLKDFVVGRQTEIEVNLERGSYIILPRTTGCLSLRRPEREMEQVPLLIPMAEIDQQMRQKETSCLDGQESFNYKKMSLVFESAVEEIFSKFDVAQTGIMTFELFKTFCDSVNRKMTPEIFADNLRQLTSTQFSKSEKHARKSKVMPPTTEEATRQNFDVPIGLTLEGFKQFLVSEIRSRNMNEEFMYQWMENMGYDTELY